ncbi:MAG: S8 family serine peptidase [Cyclobacteriaceae bacterium]
MVYFRNKSGTSFSVDRPAEWLSSRSVARRVRQQLPVTNDDLPVNPAHVAAVRDAGATPIYVSRWLNGVLVVADAALQSTLAALPMVREVELVAPGKGLAGGRLKQFRMRGTASTLEQTQIQRKMLGLDTMHALGYRGEGVMVAVIDSGFPGVDQALPFQRLLSEGRVRDQYDFVHHSTTVYAQDSHGTEVLSVLAAETASFKGGLPMADYLLYVTEDVPTEYRVEEYNWLLAAERADSAGADVITSSLGYNLFDDGAMDYLPSQLDGHTAAITRAAEMAVDRGMVVVVSAGNEGSNDWRLVTPPADGARVLAVGAVNQAGGKAGFSSVGPTSDNRVKPDVMALGINTAVVSASGAVTASSGTSFACPAIAALVGGSVQAFPDVPAEQLIEVIRKSGSLYFSPSNEKGYGIPHFLAVRNQLLHTEVSDVVRVFPNPGTGAKVQLLLTEPDGQTVQVQVYTATGVLCADASLESVWINNPVEWDVSDLAAGLYFIRVTTAKASQTVKFVKW